jgi:long-chain fatty acid transport protein
MTKTISTILGSALVLSGLAGAAQAGGLERGGYDWDLLFDAQRFSTEAGAAYVMPNRKFKNAKDLDPSTGVGSDGIGGGSTSAKGSENFSVYNFGAKVGLTPDADCLASYSQPWGVHSKPGADWVGAQSEIEQKVTSNDYGLTCSYRFDVGKGQLRAIGGVSYQEIEGFKEALGLSPNFFKALDPRLARFPGDGTGRLALEGDGVGWRVGAAYEIPEIALRASVIYNAAVDYDLEGTYDLAKIPPLDPVNRPLMGKVTDVYGSATLPQSVELKLQSGIAPDWLAFGSVKWVDWSVVDIVTFCPVSTKGTFACNPTSKAVADALNLMYRDGWTVSGGIGHKFNDKWSGAVQVAWDRGTTTGLSAQTDTWTLSGGVAFAPNKDFEVRLGGALGVMTAGSAGPLACPNAAKICNTDVSYEFGNDLVSAISISGKLKF